MNKSKKAIILKVLTSSILQKKYKFNGAIKIRDLPNLTAINKIEVI